MTSSKSGGDGRTDPTDIGNNRTGIQMSPIDAKRMVEGAEEGTPETQMTTEPTELTSARVNASRSAEPLGTMPPPGSVKGAAKAVVQALKGRRATVFLDLLGARLAFERTGTRLYESALVKLDASEVHAGGPTRGELEHFRDQELEHFAMLVECIQELGADPTAVTPSADVEGVASSGVVQIVSDPRTTLTQALDAVLVAELADHDGWQLLIDLAHELGQDEMVARFHKALAEEDEHLARVRSWLSASIMSQAGLTSPQETGSEAPPPPGAA